MRYRLYNNSKQGNHCVQACLKMLLYSFGMPVLSLKQLDEITVHDPKMFTWMTDTLIWLVDQGFIVENHENLDYPRFAREGKTYLKKLWNAETFAVQEKYSDLDREQKAAKEMLKSGVRNFNHRLTLREIENKHQAGWFMLLSVNPFALTGRDGYGSHMIVIQKFTKKYMTVLDPDRARPMRVSRDCLQHAISKKRKNDFNAIFVRLNPE